MTKRLKREYRDQKLTPQEVAQDKAVRRQVQREFPPVKNESSLRPDSLSEDLRSAIRDSEKSVYQIAKEADVSQIVISRFLSGERDIRLCTADKLAETERVNDFETTAFRI